MIQRTENMIINVDFCFLGREPEVRIQVCCPLERNLCIRISLVANSLIIRRTEDGESDWGMISRVTKRCFGKR